MASINRLGAHPLWNYESSSEAGPSASCPDSDGKEEVQSVEPVICMPDGETLTKLWQVLNNATETLVRCAGGDGNLLFNVGPMPDGRIEPRQVERLKEMGEWLGKYGETIYGTRGGPWKPTKSIASTRKGSTIYLHLLGWKGKTINLPNIPRKIISSTALTGGPAHVQQGARKISIRVDSAMANPPDHGAELLRPSQSRPANPPQIDCIVKLELDGSAMDLNPL